MTGVVVEPRIEVRWTGKERQEAVEQVLAGLLEPPRTIPSRHFYDERGSDLFHEITRLDEYYQTRTERKILVANAPDIARITRAQQLEELGAGTAEKTRILLDALFPDTLETYLPLDVSEGLLRRVAWNLAREYPGLFVHGIVGDFTTHLETLPPADPDHRRLTAFLGGTIGNLHPDDEAPGFVESVGKTLSPGDLFLLGVDLVKDPTVIEDAYNDSRGVTAEFNLNVLRVVNELLDADFEIESFAHEAVWVETRRWIEMRLRAKHRHEVRIGLAGTTVTIEEGETIRTEISAKYDPDRVARLLAPAGLEPVAWYTDEDRYFGLSLSQKP